MEKGIGRKHGKSEANWEAVVVGQVGMWVAEAGWGGDRGLQDDL